jgi:hypothetical protein
MLKKAMVTILLTAILLLAPSNRAWGAGGQVVVTVPGFPVTLNELNFGEDDYAPYPLLVYRNITYFPMTYYSANLLNLDTNWTAGDGLVITQGNPETPKEFAYATPGADKNRRTQTATVIDAKVTVNGQAIDNRGEPYPLLLFRDITYFPLTWRFAVEEFGWNYTFDYQAGLNIRADNFFYTANGDSGIDDSVFYSVENETHYLKGDLRIYLTTRLGRLIGPLGGNLHIIKSGVEIRPEAWFGYYQKNGPLFTLDGNFISTVYYTDPDLRNSQPCRVSIATGEIF